MADKSVHDFSPLVCSAPAVRNAFSETRPTRLWWGLILRLHGKPHDPRISEPKRVGCIADGFRFYAGLYRSLAVVFCLLAPVLYAAGTALEDRAPAYWATASLLGGAYLWLVSGLGYAGAKSYRQSDPKSVSALIGFMVMIVAFLSLFLSAVSIVAHQCGWLATGPNLTGAAALFVFGVGSYFIEIVYLATEGNLPRMEGKQS